MRFLCLSVDLARTSLKARRNRNSRRNSIQQMPLVFSLISPQHQSQAAHTATAPSCSRAKIQMHHFGSWCCRGARGSAVKGSPPLLPSHPKLSPGDGADPSADAHPSPLPSHGGVPSPFQGVSYPLLCPGCTVTAPQDPGMWLVPRQEPPQASFSLRTLMFSTAAGRAVCQQ